MLKRRTAAFSLIELLVVVAIVAVLAALALPFLSRARNQALETKCGARLHSLGACMGLYGADHDGTFVQALNDSNHRWALILAPYVVPSLAAQAALHPNGSPVNNQIFQSGFFKDPLYDSTAGGTAVFGYNQYLVQGVAVQFPVRFTAVTHPSQFPVLATSDDTGGITLGYGGPTAKALKLGYTGQTTPGAPAPNYGRKALFLFADWHVAEVDVCDPHAWPWNDATSFQVK